MNESIEQYRTHVDTKLIIRQRIFFGIIVVLLVISTFNIFNKTITLTLGLSGLVLSTLIGVAISRMFKIFWHEEKGKVISQLDAVGVVILVVYILIELGRKWIFSHWLSGAQLNSFGLIILTGLLLGRFLGTSFKIKTVLSEKAPQVD